MRVNFQISVSDMEPVLTRLRQLAWPLYREPSTAWYKVGDHERGSLEVLVQDLSGYLVRLSQILSGRVEDCRWTSCSRVKAHAPLAGR